MFFNRIMNFIAKPIDFSLVFGYRKHNILVLQLFIECTLKGKLFFIISAVLFGPTRP